MIYISDLCVEEKTNKQKTDYSRYLEVAKIIGDNKGHNQNIKKSMKNQR